jgi:ATP-dependent DNA ligase
MWEGKDLQARPLQNRREFLRSQVMPNLPAVRHSDSFAVTAGEIVAAVRSQGLEGVVAKRLDSGYEPGRRSGAWVKVRIGGYTPSPKTFDALLVGYYEGDKLIFAARVRNGFVPATRETVFRYFKRLHSKNCPLANLPETKQRRWGEGLTAANMEKCIWLEPELVAAIEYAEWSPASHLRHSKFIALRDDKDPKQVTHQFRLAGLYGCGGPRAGGGSSVVEPAKKRKPGQSPP